MKWIILNQNKKVYSVRADKLIQMTPTKTNKNLSKMQLKKYQSRILGYLYKMMRMDPRI